MSENKPRGIVDPWKQVDPIHKPTREKKNLEDHDPDEEFAPRGTYVIRSKHVSFRVVHVRVQSGKDAVDVLADCLFDLFKDKQLRHELSSAGIGTETKAGVQNRPVNEQQASWIRGGEARIWFNQTTVDLGMRALAKIVRSPAASKTLQRWGVTPMTAA